LDDLAQDVGPGSFNKLPYTQEFLDPSFWQHLLTSDPSLITGVPSPSPNPTLSSRQLLEEVIPSEICDFLNIDFGPLIRHKPLKTG